MAYQDSSFLLFRIGMGSKAAAYAALLTFSMLGFVASEGSVFEHLANFLRIHVDSLAEPDCPTIIKNASYGKVYEGSVIFGQQFVFQYYDIVQMVNERYLASCCVLIAH